MRHLPNLITFSRIVVLIILVWLVMQEWAGAATLAFLCILYGSVSDFLDGYIARKYQLITNFGKIMDALVDKVMSIGALILLIAIGYLPPATFTSIIVLGMALREIGITAIRIAAARRNIVLAAERSGKRKTIWQVTGICVLFAVPMFEKDVQQWCGCDLELWVSYIWINGYLYFILSAWLTIWSGAQYLAKYAPMIWGKSEHAE